MSIAVHFVEESPLGEYLKVLGPASAHLFVLIHRGVAQGPEYTKALKSLSNELKSQPHGAPTPELEIILKDIKSMDRSEATTEVLQELIKSASGITKSRDYLLQLVDDELNSHITYCMPDLNSNTVSNETV